jgi:hypothetical protein
MRNCVEYPRATRRPRGRLAKLRESREKGKVERDEKQYAEDPCSRMVERQKKEWGGHPAAVR